MPILKNAFICGLLWSAENMSAFSFTPARPVTFSKNASISSTTPTTFSMTLSSNDLKAGVPKTKTSSQILQARKRQWIDQSLSYYTTVTREEERRSRGQISKPSEIHLTKHKSNFAMAKKLYFARHKIKSGYPHHAERIYRGIIEELFAEEDLCDNSELAISTLLLTLLLQRLGKIKETRMAFLRFFRMLKAEQMQLLKEGDEEIHECTCSAKVLQAFALFEMKQGHTKKAYQLIQAAVELDGQLAPVLKWKQFRDAEQTVIRR